ncbi:MAG: hypothetical protein CMC31_01220 [Flavobacteriaceae bacterium]|nr:hypothetical protein [Flavobacteriaceae bacterium]RCL67059.1 MAG: hypothetical protein DBW79_02085 [Cryomorphaceae bacterium]|tara:strand:+ start:467 stop:658 length:192 start_codon:yes stop_codon:yes gene_type:complete
MYSKKKWFFISLLGILIFSSGLCIFGEALTLKNQDEAWFLLGTLALVLTNLGICLMISANNKR